MALNNYTHAQPLRKRPSAGARQPSGLLELLREPAEGESLPLGTRAGPKLPKVESFQDIFLLG